MITLLAACATPSAVQRERIVAVTSSHELILSNAAQPHRILERRPVTGLAAGERLVGMAIEF